MRTTDSGRAEAIAEYVRTHWGYNPVTGVVSGRGGRPIGKLRPDGALDCLAFPVGFKPASVLLHRAAWLLATGKWPALDLDHDDRNKANNKWKNLREATHAQNRQNLGRRGKNGQLRGTTPYHQGWRAQIKVPQGTTKHLGVFATEEEAHAAYCAAKLKLHTFNPEQK